MQNDGEKEVRKRHSTISFSGVELGCRPACGVGKRSPKQLATSRSDSLLGSAFGPTEGGRRDRRSRVAKSTIARHSPPNRCSYFAIITQEGVS